VPLASGVHIKIPHYCRVDSIQSKHHSVTEIDKYSYNMPAAIVRTLKTIPRQQGSRWDTLSNSPSLFSRLKRLMPLVTVLPSGLIFMGYIVS
jgi:hypothetical protein